MTDTKSTSLFGNMMKPFVRKMLLKQTEDGIKKLKIVSEQDGS